MKFNSIHVPLPKGVMVHRQILLVMKISVIWLLAACLQVSAHVKAQSFSYAKQNASLEDLFKAIRKQAGYEFLYNTMMVKAAREQNLRFDNTPVNEALDQAFRDQPLTYTIIGKTIVVKKKEEAPTPVQEVKIDFLDLTGTVVDSTTGKPLVGVTIKVQGTATGTTTDNAGQFHLSAPEDAVLEVSYLGYDTKAVVVNGRSSLTIRLSAGNLGLSEVVVTALGIKRESRELGYSATSVNIDNMKASKSTNFASGLEGKVAGLNVSTPPSGPGGSVKIRLRGQASFGGDNAPLIVVNGIPIYNELDGGANDNGPSGSTKVDEGDGLQSINPDDIASITVLKGAAAAALYGHRAKNGAIIITTKDGSGSQGIGVEVSTNFEMSQALDYTDFQYIYGQGENGLRPTSVAEARSSGTWSFGEKFDGKSTPQVDGQDHPYVPYKDRVKDFFRMGTNWTQTVALSGGNDKGSFRLSFANTDANSIVPNSDYHKKIINLGMTYHFTPKFSMQLNANYSKEYNKNPPVIGQQDENVSQTLYTMANSIDINWLKNHYEDENGNEIAISRFTDRTNPYWTVNKNFYNVRKDRLFGNVLLRYQFTDWLYLQGRIGQDYFTHPVDFNRATGTAHIAPAPSGYNGSFYQTLTTFRELNMDFLIGINKTFGNFGLDINLGGNQMRQESQEEGNRVTNFYVRDLYTIGNGISKNPVYGYSQRRVNSLYGSAEFSFKQMLYLTVTGRNDWYSTLNPKSNNYLYPSASLSFVFTELMNTTPGWLNYGKLRASYAEVGGDTDPYADRIYYTLDANEFNGVPLGNINTGTSPNPALRPLSVKESDIGLELQMFDSRLRLDLSAYRKNSVDEIVNVDISDASGYTQTKVNNGKLRNTGVGMLVSMEIIRGNNFSWTSAFNANYNESKVISLANGQERLDVGTGEFFGTISHEVGKPLASIRGFDYKRDDQGRILTSGGKPLQGNLTTFGSAIPKWVGGWINNLDIHGFTVTAQVDFKAGFKLLSNSNMNFLRHGLSKQSLVGREDGVVFESVDADGHPNTTAVPAEDFYNAYRSTSIATPFVYDASFIRWRTLSVGYDLSRFVKNSFLKGLRVSANINNVWLISSHVDNLDPETQYSTSDNLTGIELHSLPTTRGYGMSVDVKF